MEELMKELQEIRGQFKGICGSMQSAVKHAKEMTEKAVLKIKIADDKEALNTKASEYLVKRELKVEKIESAEKLNEESKARERATKESIAKLEKDQIAFQEQKSASLREVNNKSAVAVSKMNEANREWKLLNEAKVQYDKDKANMRENILKELTNLK